MKLKALLKTIIEIFLMIFGIAIVILVSALLLYLFINIPVWVLSYFNMMELFDKYPEDFIYATEFLIIIGICIVVWFIVSLYKNNLEEYEENYNSSYKRE